MSERVVRGKVKSVLAWLWAELKRRRVIKTTVAYVIGAWVFDLDRKPGNGIKSDQVGQPGSDNNRQYESGKLRPVLDLTQASVAVLPFKTCHPTLRISLSLMGSQRNCIARCQESTAFASRPVHPRLRFPALMPTSNRRLTIVNWMICSQFNMISLMPLQANSAAQDLETK